MKHRKKDRDRRFQARSRMRVPSYMIQSTHQLYLVEAIRRNPAIDTDGLYFQALRDIIIGNNKAVFADVAEFVDRVVSGKLKGNRQAAAVKTLLGVHRLNRAVNAYFNISEFNRRFLNDKGLFALLTILVLDAMNLDLVAIDTFRGEEGLSAAYGPRETQQQKRSGRELQKRLKQFAALDEPATVEAADRYVEYRFLDQGSLPDYKKRTELEGNPRSDLYLRQWFRKFDKALGYLPPTTGRARKSSRRR